MIRKTKHPDNRAARRALKFQKDTFKIDYTALKPKAAVEKEQSDDVGSEVSGSA